MSDPNTKPVLGLVCSLFVTCFGLSGLWYSYHTNSTSSNALEIVCISVGLPTTFIFMTYFYFTSNIKLPKLKKQQSHFELDEKPGIPREAHLTMMLADPLLRNPIMYLKYRSCSDSHTALADDVLPGCENDMMKTSFIWSFHSISNRGNVYCKQIRIPRCDSAKHQKLIKWMFNGWWSNFMAFSGVAGLRSFKRLHGGISPFSLRKRRVAKTGFLVFLVSHTMVLLINRGYRKRSKHVASKNNFGIFYSR